jgi:hypothetical protein
LDENDEQKNGEKKNKWMSYGAIDGTHIPIAERLNKKVYYCNYKLLQLKKLL